MRAAEITQHRGMSRAAASTLAEPFDDYLGRRSRSALAVSPGEAVTAAVALLRGCRDAAGRFGGTRWWLRADGCPVAMEEARNPDAVQSTAETLAWIASLVEDDATREMLACAGETVLTAPPREWEDLERRLLRHATPVPLILGPLTPVDNTLPPDLDPRSPSRGAPFPTVSDDHLLVLVGEMLDDLRARWRTSRVVRVAMVGAAAAVVAVTGALMWPIVTGPTASSSGPPRQVVASPTPARSIPVGSGIPASTETDAPTVVHDAGGRGTAPTPSAPTAVVAPDEPVQVARATFEELARCGEDTICLAALHEDASRARDLLLPDPTAEDLELIDDFGGVIVVRLTGVGGTRYVTLARGEDRWLVRAVATVADQPS